MTSEGGDSVLFYYVRYECNETRAGVKVFKVTFTWLFFFYGAAACSGPGPPHYRGFTITLSRTPLDE